MTTPPKTDEKAYVQIPFYEYQELTGIARMFRDLLSNNSARINEYYKDRISWLESDNESMRQRLRKINEDKSHARADERRKVGEALLNYLDANHYFYRDMSIDGTEFQALSISRDRLKEIIKELCGGEK